MNRVLIALLILGSLLLAACTQQQQANTAAAAIESYLQVRVTSDTQKLVALSCKAWEGQATTEADSFRSRDPHLQGLSCKETGQDGGATLVTCAGQIITNYAGNSSTYDISTKIYKVIQEDGKWKMCGYAKQPVPNPGAPASTAAATQS